MDLNDMLDSSRVLRELLPGRFLRELVLDGLQHLVQHCFETSLDILRPGGIGGEVDAEHRTPRLRLSFYQLLEILN
jgi:hypothetical protein